MGLIEVEECTSDNHGWFLVSVDGILLIGLLSSVRRITLSRIDDGDFLSYVRFIHKNWLTKKLGRGGQHAS